MGILEMGLVMVLFAVLFAVIVTDRAAAYLTVETPQGKYYWRTFALIASTLVPVLTGTAGILFVSAGLY
jgi:cytochrome bd-type quinol oxidase subunit 2